MVAVRRRVAFAFARKNSLSKVYSHIFQIGTVSGLRPAMFTHTKLVVWTSRSRGPSFSDECRDVSPRLV
jgi:hypothetical protein